MVTDENALTFREAADLLPRFHGKKVSTTTIWRWAKKGLHGVRLDARRVGRRYVTSAEALEEFAQTLARMGGTQHRAGGGR